VYDASSITMNLPVASYFQKPANQKRTIWHKLDQDWRISADFQAEHSLGKEERFRGDLV
jgi:hypothetical protein